MESSFLRLKDLLFTRLELGIIEKIKCGGPIDTVEVGLIHGWADDMEKITYRAYQEKCRLVEYYLKDSDKIKEFYDSPKIKEFCGEVESYLQLAGLILKYPDDQEKWWKERG